MLERYDPITDAVNEVLDDLELGNLKLDTGETELVKDIIKTLEPFKTATEFLCKRESKLAQAEVIIQFIDSKLEEIDSPLFEPFSIGYEHDMLRERTLTSYHW